MGEILKAAGCNYSNGEIRVMSCSFLMIIIFGNTITLYQTLCLSVVKTTVLLADINDFNSVNEVYKTCKSPRTGLQGLLKVVIIDKQLLWLTNLIAEMFSRSVAICCFYKSNHMWAVFSQLGSIRLLKPILLSCLKHDSKWNA